jgi:hypothetical protein
MKNIILIKIFEEFRDRPLRAPESVNNVDNRCWGKNRKLLLKLQKKRFSARFRVCEFLWSEQRLPEDVIRLAPTDKDQHLFLEVLINNKWVIVDCSNDSELPDYNIWDGRSDCKLGVKYTKILSVGESHDIEGMERKNFKKILPDYIVFHKTLNRFFESSRKAHQKK